MIFQKISVATLLTLCSIHTSECGVLLKRHDCHCSNAIRNEETSDPNQNILFNNGLKGKLEADHQELTDLDHGGINAMAGDLQSFAPMQYYQPRITPRGDIHLNPTSYPAKHAEGRRPSSLDLDPYFTEALLKQIWLSHQQSQKNDPQAKNIKIQSETHTVKPLTQHVVFPDNFEVPHEKETDGGNVRYDFLSQKSRRNPDYSNYGLKDNILHFNHNTVWKSGNENFITPIRDSFVQGVHNLPYRYDNYKQKTSLPNPAAVKLSEYSFDKRRGNVQFRPKLMKNKLGFQYYDTKLFNDDKQMRLKTYVNQDHKLPQKHEVTEYRQFVLPVHIPPNKMPLKQQNTGKFGKWISEQIQILNSQNAGPEKIDFTGLGYSILQILRENGMYITDNGMIIDTYGTASNIHTLSLTPIIIGNTIPLRQLLQSKYGTISSQSQIPYLQAILVSATDPHKILGILPIGKPHLPLSTFNKVTKTWGLQSELNSEENIGEKDNPKQNVPENPNPSVTKKTNHQEDYQRLNSLSMRNEIFGRRGLRPDVDDNDDRPYSKQFEISQDELDSNNAGRLFIPSIEFREHPIDVISTRRKHIPIKIINSDVDKYNRIHLPSISKLIKLAFRRDSSPTPNDFFQEISDKSTNTDVYEKQRDVNDLAISVGAQIVPERFIQIVDENSQPILELNSQNHHTYPLVYTDDNIEENMHYTSPDDQNETGSRSAVEPEQVPEIPVESIHDGNSAFELVDNDEDDDGDFRIIGGNAATGSGTPLSNKGRSGYVF